MKIETGILNINGCEPSEGFRLPVFRDKKRAINIINKGISAQHLSKLGENTAKRILPYTAQNIYNGELNALSIKTITIENENIKAVILPDYGGRVWSLYDKNEQKELLFKNSVFRVRNLAIRNAWFAGGIEWNIGHFGHSVQTNEPMFFAKMKNKQGEEFLRGYEYERQNGLYYCIDFHLPKNAKELYVYVRIINAKNEKAPLYWWTNTAVKEEKNIRIFSGTKEVFYIVPDKTEKDHCFASGKLPYLDTMNGVDASYPMNFNYSCEYFYQNPKNINSCYEVVAYDDGKAFFERSTEKLNYKKMFCWGMGKGAIHWKDFLSVKGEGNYLEIQAGLAPSQVHGACIEPFEEIEFTQAFGCFSHDSGETNKELEKANSYIAKAVEKRLSAECINKAHIEFSSYKELLPQELIHYGSGFGALEGRLFETQIPKGLLFPQDSITEKEQYFIEIKEKGLFLQNTEKIPKSYLTEQRFISIIEKALEKTPDQMGYIHYGINLIENGSFEKGLSALEKAKSMKDDAFVNYCISAAHTQQKDFELAYGAIKQTVAKADECELFIYACYFIQAATLNGDFKAAFDYFSTLSETQRQNEQLILSVLASAYELGKYDFLNEQFTKEFSCIREGENDLSELFYKVKAKEQATNEQDFEMTLAQLKKTISPPYNIDFAMK